MQTQRTISGRMRTCAASRCAYLAFIICITLALLTCSSQPANADAATGQVSQYGDYSSAAGVSLPDTTSSSVDGAASSSHSMPSHSASTFLHRSIRHQPIGWWVGIGSGVAFFLTLFFSSLPSLLLRGEQLTRRKIQVLATSAAICGSIMLASAWVVLLPRALQMGFTSTDHTAILDHPVVPLVIIMVGVLLPRVLEWSMVSLLVRRPSPLLAARGIGGGGVSSGSMWYGLESGGEESDRSAPPTPAYRPLMPRTSAPLVPGSRRPSGFGGVSGEHGAEERKAIGRGPTAHEETPLTGGGAGGDLELGIGTPYGIHPSTTTLSQVPTPLMRPSPARPSTRGMGAAALYGSARLSVDAEEFKARQPFLARCAMCKDNITNTKGLAYHAAGCDLKSKHSFTLSSRWLQAYRGARMRARDAMIGAAGTSTTTGETEQDGLITRSIVAYVITLMIYQIILAGMIDLQRLAGFIYALAWSEEYGHGIPSSLSSTWHREIVHLTLQLLTVVAFLAFYSVAFGMMLSLHRVSTWKSWRGSMALILWSVALPLGGLINVSVATMGSSSEEVMVMPVSDADSDGRVTPSSIAMHPSSTPHTIPYARFVLIMQCLSIGLLLHQSIVDVILEEWARRDAMKSKTIAATLTIATVTTLAILLG